MGDDGGPRLLIKQEQQSNHRGLARPGAKAGREASKEEVWGLSAGEMGCSIW